MADMHQISRNILAYRRVIIAWSVPLLVMGLLNLGLYTLLAPSAAQPVAPDLPHPVVPVAATATATPAPVASGTVFTEGLTLLPGDVQGGLTDGRWLVLAGDWQTEQSSLVQRDTSGYDRIISYRPPLERVRLRVTLRHLDGVGGGVVFHMPQPERRNGAHMVRYADDGSALFWGFFDDAGDFVGQGSALVPNPGTVAHTLEITSSQDSYTITLDGITIAQDMPLTSTRGSVGLVASQSAVAFDALEVLPQQEQEQTAAVVPAGGLDNLSFLSGTWVREGTTVRQLDQDATDFVSATGIAAERYTLRVTLLLPDDPELPDVGAGVLFHMPAQDSINGAQMVRLGGSGREIFWGAFDEAGVFEGQGQAELPAAPGKPCTLTLVVAADTYTILVDEQEIAAAVPLQDNGGWIGLLSFRGPVSFQDVRLTLGSDRNEG